MGDLIDEVLLGEAWLDAADHVRERRVRDSTRFTDRRELAFVFGGPHALDECRCRYDLAPGSNCAQIQREARVRLVTQSHPYAGEPKIPNDVAKRGYRVSVVFNDPHSRTEPIRKGIVGRHAG